MKESLHVKLLLDEMIPTDLARTLREYGYDVLTTSDVDLLGKDDEEVLEYAISEGRSVLTFNIGDFVALHQNVHKQGKKHSGIVV